MDTVTSGTTACLMESGWIVLENVSLKERLDGGRHSTNISHTCPVDAGRAVFVHTRLSLLDLSEASTRLFHCSDAGDGYSSLDYMRYLELVTTELEG